jgi:hypothetical protein
MVLLRLLEARCRASNCARDEGVLAEVGRDFAEEWGEEASVWKLER